MPKIHLRYLAPICDIVSANRETLEIAENSSLMDVIAGMCRQYGQPVRDLFYDSSEMFRPMFIILRNGKALDLDEMTEPLEDGDTVSFVPPIAGG